MKLTTYTDLDLRVDNSTMSALNYPSQHILIHGDWTGINYSDISFLIASATMPEDTGEIEGEMRIPLGFIAGASKFLKAQKWSFSIFDSLVITKWRLDAKPVNLILHCPSRLCRDDSNITYNNDSQINIINYTYLI